VTPATANPGHLKLELAASGVHLHDSVERHAAACRPPRLEGHTAGEVEIVLPGDVVASAVVDAPDRARSPFVLSAHGDQFTLEAHAATVDVRLLAQPAFYRLTTSSGVPMSRVGTTHGSCIAINPTFACGYSLRGAPCRFCRNGTGISLQDGFTVSAQDVIEVVRAAFAEGAIEFVYFNLAYVGTEDAGIAFLEPYIRAVKRHFDTLVAVQIHPPKDNRWIDRTYAMGVDALSYAVEVHDVAALGRLCAGRVRYIGRDRYYEALQYAATVFPSGTVWSDLVVGLEPPESTARGIDTLVGLGVLPVLSLFRPATQGPGHAGALETVIPVYAHLFEKVRDAKINMGWVRDLSFAITPLEARYFAGDDARVAVAWQQFYRSRLGTIAARNLARLRRQLRVRQVSDSFDSSGL
jgi:hypothetical protein